MCKWPFDEQSYNLAEAEKEDLDRKRLMIMEPFDINWTQTGGLKVELLRLFQMLTMI